MIKDYLKKNYDIANIYQNFDQINFFVVFQKEEYGKKLEKELEESNGLIKSILFIKFMKYLKNFKKSSNK